MPRLTDEQKAERKARRRARRARTWDSIRTAIRHAVNLAELLFPAPGSGATRHAWVTSAVKLIKTPAGDEVEEVVVRFLIELAVDEL